MAIDLKLDGNHDLDLADDDLVWVRDSEEVLQSVTIRVLFIRYEWAYDFTIGVPWGHGLFDVRIPRVKKEAWLKDAIVQTVGVRALTAFDFKIDREQNGALIVYTAETNYGPVQGEVST